MSRIKKINGTDNYWITSDGRVLSNNRHARYKKRRWKTQRLQNSGYPVVDIVINGKQKTRTVHRLVAEAFIPNPEKLQQVNHIDGNKQNNKVSNLEWCTASRNIQHSYDIGKRKKGAPQLVPYHGLPLTEKSKTKIAKKKTKISINKAKEIREHIINKTMTYAQIREKYKVGGGTINMCRDNSFRIYNLDA